MARTTSVAVAVRTPSAKVFMATLQGGAAALGLTGAGRILTVIVYPSARWKGSLARSGCMGTMRVGKGAAGTAHCLGTVKANGTPVALG
jgi:hypothetical protein